MKQTQPHFDFTFEIAFCEVQQQNTQIQSNYSLAVTYTVCCSRRNTQVVNIKIEEFSLSVFGFVDRVPVQ